MCLSLLAFCTRPVQSSESSVLTSNTCSSSSTELPCQRVASVRALCAWQPKSSRHGTLNSLDVSVQFIQSQHHRQRLLNPYVLLTARQLTLYTHRTHAHTHARTHARTRQCFDCCDLDLVQGSIGCFLKLCYYFFSTGLLVVGHATNLREQLGLSVVWLAVGTVVV